MSDPQSVFDRATLARICTMPERKFAGAFGLDRYEVKAQSAPDDFYLYRDNGSKILAVAHLDTVGQAHERGAHFVNTEAGPVVYSRALDDRLGAYTILDLMPKLGIEFDILLTVGEESGRSTAAFFDSPKQYDWMIEFDRGGTDVVMYQYDDDQTRAAVKACGATVGDGIFSDISYLDHVGAKGFNWGVGYRDYHGPRAHAYLNDYFDMMDDFLVFHEQNDGVRMPYVEGSGYGGSSWWGRGSAFDWDQPLSSRWLAEGEPGYDDLDEHAGLLSQWDRGEVEPDPDLPDDPNDPFYVRDHFYGTPIDRKAG